jgi:hypothetical protein
MTAFEDLGHLFAPATWLVRCVPVTDRVHDLLCRQRLSHGADESSADFGMARLRRRSRRSASAGARVAEATIIVEPIPSQKKRAMNTPSPA